MIDQTRLPFAFELRHLQRREQAADAIRDMVVRGAPLIGVTAAYGVALGMRADPSDAGLARAVQLLGATRPTAVNLRWALARMQPCWRASRPNDASRVAYAEAARIADEDVAACAAIGRHGLRVLERLRARPRRPPGARAHALQRRLARLRGLGHGARAGLRRARRRASPLHVYVDETRPRNQGAALTAFELGAHGVPHTVIADNAGGHLMQHGQVDVCIVGSDRTTATGDVANKIGTYLKALAARDNGVPFYAALPSSTIDWTHRGRRARRADRGARARAR